MLQHIIFEIQTFILQKKTKKKKKQKKKQKKRERERYKHLLSSLFSW